MKDFLNWLIPVVFCISGIYWFWKSSNSDEEEMITNDDNINENGDDMKEACQNESIKSLLERTMKNIGCHINMCAEKDNEFNITYQGEHFSVVYSDDSPYITIYDIAWYSEELNDIDNFSMVTKAVNLCNQRNTSTVLYTIDKENNCVNVHTRQCVVFGSYIPKLEDYLRSMFEDSFQQHHNFYRCMELNRKEQFV